MGTGGVTCPRGQRFLAGLGGPSGTASCSLFKNPVLAGPNLPGLRNDGRGLIGERAFHVTRIHRGHNVIVRLARGNRVVSELDRADQRRIQLRWVRTTRRRSAIDVVATDRAGARGPSQRHGVWCGCHSGSRDSNRCRRIRGVARDRYCAAHGPCCGGCELYGDGDGLIWGEHFAGADTARRKRCVRHAETRDGHVGVAVVGERNAERVAASNVYATETQAGRAQAQHFGGGNACPAKRNGY